MLVYDSVLQGEIMLPEKAAKELQSAFETIDFYTRPAAPGPEFLVVGSKSIAIKIKMYGEAGPHKAAHIHIDYGKQNHVASYEIATGKRLVGDLENKYDKIVSQWIKRYQSDLQEAWDWTAAGRKPEHIIAKLKGTLD